MQSEEAKLVTRLKREKACLKKLLVEAELEMAMRKVLAEGNL